MYNRPSNRVQFGKTNYQDVEEEGPPGYAGSPAKTLIDFITAAPHNIKKTIYDAAALPIEGIGWLFGQDWNPSYGEYQDIIKGEDLVRYEKEMNPLKQVPGSVVENEMIAYDFSINLRTSLSTIDTKNTTGYKICV